MKRYKLKCPNCKAEYTLTAGLIQEKDFNGVIASYVECPVCGENILLQLDSTKTKQIAKKAVKYELLRLKRKKLSPKQKKEMISLNSQLIIQRKKLNKDYWDSIHQQLNSCLGSC